MRSRDKHITLALFTSNDRIEIGKFCTLAQDVVIFGGGRFQETTIERLLDIAWWNWPATKIAANLELLYAKPDEWPSDIEFNEAQRKTLNLVDMTVLQQSDAASRQAHINSKQVE